MATRTEILSTGISRLAVNTVVSTTVLTALGVFLATLRFHLRRRDALGVDDYILMVALIFVLLQLVFAYLIGFLSGSGWSIEDLAQHPDRVTWILKLIYFPELSYTVTVVLIKSSILYSYKRIFGRMKSTRYHIYALLGLTWVWGVVFFFVILFQCNPIDRAWMPQKPGHCISTVPFLWGNSVSNFAIDWLILAVPILPIRSLQLSRTKKALVALSFLVGSLACVASTIRSASTSTFDPEDLGISDYNASLWVYLEPPLAVISCCLPFLSRLFGEKMVKLINQVPFRSTKNTSDSSTCVTTQQDKDLVGRGETHQTYHSRDESRSALDAVYSHKRSIQMMTTTSVTGHAAEAEGHEMSPWSVSVTAPPATAWRVESSQDFV